MRSLSHSAAAAVLLLRRRLQRLGGSFTNDLFGVARKSDSFILHMVFERFDRTHLEI